MANAKPQLLFQPIFHESLFSEHKPSPDPTDSETKEPSSNATYMQIEDLLKMDLFGIRSARIVNNQVLGLNEAHGRTNIDSWPTVMRKQASLLQFLASR